MNHATRLVIEQAADRRRRGIADEKGAEYTGAGKGYQGKGADVLRNFKVNADRLGLDVYQTCGLYFGKHVDSFFTFVREFSESFHDDDLMAPEEVVDRGEGIISRLDDMRNYIDLFECLLAEDGWHPTIINESEAVVQPAAPSLLAQVELPEELLDELTEELSNVPLPGSEWAEVMRILNCKTGPYPLPLPSPQRPPLYVNRGWGFCS